MTADDTPGIVAGDDRERGVTIRWIQTGRDRATFGEAPSRSERPERAIKRRCSRGAASPGRTAADASDDTRRPPLAGYAKVNPAAGKLGKKRGGSNGASHHRAAPIGERGNRRSHDTTAAQPHPPMTPRHPDNQADPCTGQRSASIGLSSATLNGAAVPAVRR
jgi:hypothetical protein